MTPHKEKLIEGVVYEVHTVFVPTRIAYEWRRQVDAFNETTEDKVSDSHYGMGYVEGNAYHYVT